MKTGLISVVVPCYNEADNLDEFFRRIAILKDNISPRQLECIFINDGSNDTSETILNEYAVNHKWIKVLHFAQNRGHQIALMAGIDHALGDVIVTIDADLQDPPELIFEMIHKIEDGYEIIHTQRKHRSGENWFKRFTAKSFYWMLKKFSSTPIIRDSGDFRAFTKSVQKTVMEFRMPYPFLRGIFPLLGFKQYMIYYNREPRYLGKTKFSLRNMIHFSVDGFMGFSSAPIQIIQWFSIILWLISAGYLIKSLIAHFYLKTTVPGWTSIIVLMFFFTGLILFSIAIIGSYVGRIFIQGQHLPLYWLCDARNIESKKVIENAGKIREVKMASLLLNEPPKDQHQDDDDTF